MSCCSLLELFVRVVYIYSLFIIPNGGIIEYEQMGYQRDNSSYNSTRPNSYLTVLVIVMANVDITTDQ